MDALEDSSLALRKAHWLLVVIVFVVRFDHMWLDSKHHRQILKHLALFVLVLLLVVGLYLAHEVRIYSAKSTNKLEYKLSNILNLL